MPVQIEHFPDNPAHQQHCFVCTRPDGSRVVFGCDSEENCNSRLHYWQTRAHTAEKNGWKDL